MRRIHRRPTDQAAPAPPLLAVAPRPGPAAQLLFLAPAVIYMVAFFGYPVVKNFLMAFQKYTTSTFYTGEAPWVGLANYAAVLDPPVFSKAVLNTVLFTAGSIVWQFAIGLALAVFFRRRFPLSGVLRSLLLLPWLIPLIVSGAVWRWMLDKDNGALNRFLAAICVDRPPRLADQHRHWR